MGGIPWYSGAIDAYARAGRARRQMGAVSSLAGDAGQYLGRLRGDERAEDLDNAEMALLRARLGLQENQAAQQAQPASSDPSIGNDPGISGIDNDPLTGKPAGGGGAWDSSSETYSFPEARAPLVEQQLGGPNAGATLSRGATPFPPTEGPAASPGALRSPTNAAPDSGQPETGGGGSFGSSMQRLAGHYLSPLGIMRDPTYAGRKMALGRLAGTVARQTDEMKRVQAVSRLLPFTQDPGAVLSRIAPTLGIHPGDIKNIRGMGGYGVGGVRTRFEAMLAKHDGDPAAALDEWNKTTGGQVKTPFEAFLMDAGGDYHKALQAYQEWQGEAAYARSPMGQMDRFNRGRGGAGGSPGGPPVTRPGSATPSPSDTAPPNAGTPGVQPQGPSLNDQVDQALSGPPRAPDGHLWSGRFKLTRD